MSAPTSYRLGVDFGTSTTIAMLHRPDGRIRPLLFDGSPLMSSAVLLGTDGRLHTGRDAAHLARSAPDRLEPNPKRRVDDGTVLLGSAEVPARDLVAAVLRRVADEARQVGGQIGEVVLTHPAAWGPGRRAFLIDAAERAGLRRPDLVAEPVAAANYFARMMGAALPPGAGVLVYDLGAGTCDVTLLRRQPHGFDTLASSGLNDVGGLDVDAAIVAFLEATYGQLWADAAARRQLWDEVRNAKEMLSRASGTVVAIPALGVEAPLGREQLEGLARPVLRPTIAMTKALLRETGVGAAGVSGLFVVGGSGRMPIISTLLHQELGIAPIVTDQPELVVAEGSLFVHSGGTMATAPTAAFGPVGGPQPVGAPPTGPQPTGPQPTGPQLTGPQPIGPQPTGAPPVSAPPTTGSPLSAQPVSALPVSALPVSGLPASGPPASGPPTGGSPVSALPASSSAFGTHQMGPQPFGPPGMQGPRGMQGPPGVQGPRGPRSPYPPPARRRSRPTALIVVAATAVLFLLITGTTAGYLWLAGNRDNGNQSGAGADGPGAGGPGAGGPSGTGSVSGGTGAVPVKYDINRLPENLCSRVDVGPLAGTFEKQADQPTSNRNLNSTISTYSCIVIRQHGPGTTVASQLILNFIASVFADGSLAVSAHQSGFDSAKLSTPETALVPGLGDHAFIHPIKGTSSDPAKEANFTLEVRDANLRWQVIFTGTRLQGAAWTEAERTQLRSRFIDTVKASHSKLNGG